MSTSIKHNFGFTFIELMIVLSLIIMLGNSMIPSMQNLLTSNRYANQINTLLSFLQLARNEAVITNRKIILCKSADLKQCEPESNWLQGWIIFADSNNNKIKDSDEKILFVHRFQTRKQDKIIFKSFQGNDYVQFTPLGQSHTNGTFIFCHPTDNNKTQSLVISQTGRIRVNSKPSLSILKQCS